MKSLCKVGLLGGSFDPIHNGHLNLAFELLERRNLDEVWFIPTFLNPHKSSKPPLAFEHRLHMLEKAIFRIRQFKVNAIESKLPAPSYTINTVKALLNEFSEDHSFFLLLAEDLFPGFYSWCQVDELVKLIPILIGSRNCEKLCTESLQHDCIVSQAIQKGVVKTHLIDLSSSILRDRLARGLYCGHLIPNETLEYIYENHLYGSRRSDAIKNREIEFDKTGF